MTEMDDNLIKHREIQFSELHPDANQAHSAMAFLAGIEGMLGVQIVNPICVQVRYNVNQVSLQLLEQALEEMGYHLDNRLMNRLKRGLYYYTEETQRANMGCPRGDSSCTLKVFVNRYQHLEHGCRDNRPDHWRKYL